MRSRAVLAAVVAFVLIDIALLGCRPLLSPDEVRYGSIAAQMLESGDWLHLRMSGFHFYEKPPLVYWMTASSLAVCGHNAFALRLPAALCAALAAFALGVAVHRQQRLAGKSADDSVTVAALCALMYVTTVLVTVCASVSIMDGPLSGFLTASCACFYVAGTQPAGQGAKRTAWLVAAGVAAALAFMTKGLLSIALPAVTVLPWLAWERRWRAMWTWAWIPVAVAAVCILPWAALMHSAEPLFWDRFIIHEHFRRFAGGAENQPGQTWAFYLLVLPIGLVPWIASLPVAARWWPAMWRADSGVRFAICWAMGPLVLMSLSSGKLPTYIVPVVAPCVWLLTVGLLRALEESRLRARAVGPRSAGSASSPQPLLPLVPGAILVLLGVCALVLAIPMEWSGSLLHRVWLQHAHVNAALLACALLCWGAGDWWAQRTDTAQRHVMRSGLSLIPGFMCFALLLPDALVNDFKIPERSLLAERERIGAAPTVIAEVKMGHALAWCLQRSDFLIMGAPEEFDNGLQLPDETARLLNTTTFAPRLAEARTRGAVAVLLSDTWTKRVLALPGVEQPASIHPHAGWSLLLYEPLGLGSRPPR